MTSRGLVSVVVPVYNEEDNVRPLYEEIRAHCDALAPWELLFVDDGSTDATAAEAGRLQREDARVRVVRLRRNCGQTAAMAAGFDLARGDVIVSMDGDLQNDPADIPRLLDKLDEGYEVVCGWRRRRRDRFWTRRLPSLAANRLIGAFTGVKVHDLGCSLKAYRGSVIKSVALYGQLHRFIPTMASIVGARIAEIVVNHRPRHSGASKYGIGRAWGVGLDIVTVKMLTGFASRPATWFVLLSLPSMLLASFACVSAFAAYDQRSPTRPLMIAAVALLFTMLTTHLLAMAVLGQLFAHTAHRRGQHPGPDAERRA